MSADSVYFGIYHRDLLAGQLVLYAVLRPDETVADSGSYSISDPHYPAAYALTDYRVPESAPAGTWKIAVVYEGERYEHPFTVTVDGPVAAGSVPDGAEVPGTSLRVEKTTADEIALTWGESCVPSDIDYAIYAGTLGSFTSHGPVLCSTGGATTLTFAPLGGSRYYLVVPTNGAEEGSYGTDSSGAERPQVAGACLDQVAAACP
jgi:hypothetical protein